MAETTRELTAEEQFHYARKEIDGVIQYVGRLKDDTRPEYRGSGRELALAYTKLQEAKMWVGKALEALGTPFPEELRDIKNQ